MALDKELVDIIHEVAEEQERDPNQVSFAVTSVFKFIVNKMKENVATKEDPTIILNYWGKFKVKERRRSFLIKTREAEGLRLLKIAKGLDD